MLPNAHPAVKRQVADPVEGHWGGLKCGELLTAAGAVVQAELWVETAV